MSGSEIQAEIQTIIGSTVYIGSKVVNLGGIPASHRRRIQNFIDHYLGSPEEPVPFGGRDPELQELSQWLDNADVAPRILLTAPAGRGKTALLVNWLQTIPTEVKIVFAPISNRFQTNRAEWVYEALARQLEQIAEQSPAETSRDASTYYLDRCLQLLDIIALRNTKVVVIIDGLDETAGWEFDSALFANFGGAIRFVVSARMLAGDNGPDDWLRRLELSPQRAIVMSVAPLTRSGFQEALESMGHPISSLTDREEILDSLVSLTSGDPLLVRLYSDWLWANKDHVEAISTDELGQIDIGYEGFFGHWFSKQAGSWKREGSVESNQLNAILAVLSVTLGPMRHQELSIVCRQMLGSDQLYFTSETLSPIKRFLLGDGVEIGYSFQHPKFQEYFRCSHFKDPSITSRAEAAILCWSRSIVLKLNEKSATNAEAPSYVLDHYCQHLLMQLHDGAGASPVLESIEQLVIDGWWRAWLARDGSYERYLVDIRAIMGVLEQWSGAEEPRAFSLNLRCALIESSICSIGQNTPWQLVLTSVRHKILSGRQGLHLLKQQDDKDQAESLPELFELVDHQLQSDVLEVVNLIADPVVKHRALALLAKRERGLEQQHLFLQAIKTAEEIGNGAQRCQSLGALAQLLPKPMQSEVFRLALLAAEKAENPRVAAIAVRDFAEHLPEPLLEWALRIAEQVGDETRCWVLCAIAERLPEPLLERAIGAVAALCDGPTHRPGMYGSDKSLAFVLLARRLSEPHRSLVLELALSTVYRVELKEQKTKALCALAKIMPELEQLQLVERVLECARLSAGTYGGGNTAEDLVSLVDWLPEPLFELVLSTVQHLRDEYSKSRVLIGIAGRLPDRLLEPALEMAQQMQDAGAVLVLAERLTEPQRLKIIEDTVNNTDWKGQLIFWNSKVLNFTERLDESLQTIFLGYWSILAERDSSVQRSAEMLGILAQRLDEPRRSHVIEILLSKIEQHDDTGVSSRALADIAEHLPVSMLDRALRAAERIGDGKEQVKALRDVSGHLIGNQSERVLAYALTGVERIADPSIRSAALCDLVKHLPDELLERALAIAEDLDWEQERSRALEALVPRLPKPLLENVLTTAEHFEEDEFRADLLMVLADHLPEQLVGRALAIAEEVGNEWARVDAIGALSERFPEPERSRLVETAFAAAERIGDPRARSGALRSVSDHAADPRRSQMLRGALVAAEQIDDIEKRLYVLRDLAGHVPDPLRLRALGSELTAIEQASDKTKIDELTLLSRCLPEPLLERALQVANQIADEGWKFYVLVRLAEYLPAPLLEEVLDATEHIVDDKQRAYALTELSKRLPASLLDRMLKAAEEMVSAPAKSEILQALASRLPDPLVERAMEAAKQIDDPYYAFYALIDLVHRLSEPTRSRVVENMLNLVSESPPWIRPDLLNTLSRYLPKSLVEPAWEVAERSAFVDKLSDISAIALRLPEPRRSSILEQFIFRTEELDDMHRRFRLFFELSRHLPEPQRSLALEGALAAVEQNTVASERAQDLSDLVKKLPERFLERAVVAAELIRDDRARYRALSRVADQLPEALVRSFIARLPRNFRTGSRAAVLDAFAIYADRVNQIYGRDTLAALAESIDKTAEWWP